MKAKTQTLPRLSERQLEKTCSDFLALDGWRSLKTDPVSDRSRGKGFGELGMADMLYIRYWTGCIDQTAHAPPYESWGQILWIEFKRQRPGRTIFTKAEKAKIHQCAWIARECQRGALVLLAGVDFKPATFEAFKAWYLASGLNRRMR